MTATNVEADYIVANYGLTVSGFPVATGTGAGADDHAVLSNLDFASAGHTGFASTVDTDALAASGVATDAQVTANQAEFLSASGTLVNKTGDTMTGALVAPTVTVSESLTISGQPVSTGTGGGGTSDHSALNNLDYASAGHTGFAQALAVKESDNDPTVSDVNTIIVDVGSLTDEGGGQVRLTTSGIAGEVITAVTGTFTQSLTVSGVPVSTAAFETGPWYTTFTMQADGVQVLTNEVAATVSSITETTADAGGFTVTDGVVEVPTGQGYTHVRLQGQLAFEPSTTGFRQGNLIMNGETVWKDTNGDKVFQPILRMQALDTIGKNDFLQVHSPMVAVSGGTQFSMRAYQNSGGDLDIVGGAAAAASGTVTYLQIEGFKKVT